MKSNARTLRRATLVRLDPTKCPPVDTFIELMSQSGVVTINLAWLVYSDLLTPD